VKEIARHAFATKADLDKAVSELTKAMSELMIRLVLTMIGVAGLALAVAKALGRGWRWKSLRPARTVDSKT
jgi:hypothetical protein